MTSLLDVNVLIALFDPVHACHEAAHEWLSRNRQQGWATCPITENGFVRVISHPSYPGRRTMIHDAIQRLGEFCESGDHTFWSDSLSLRRAGRFRPVHVQGPRQLTDVYLLALSVVNGGRLATFDRSIRFDSVVDAREEHLETIG